MATQRVVQRFPETGSVKKDTMMAKTVRQRQRVKAKKRNRARDGRRGLAGIYDKRASGESTGNVTLSFSSPEEVKISGQRRRALMRDIGDITKAARARALSQQDGRNSLADYTGTSGHPFHNLVRFSGLTSTAEIAEIIINTRLMSSLATKTGLVVEDIAATLPLAESQSWLRLDSRKTLRDKVAETLGADILKQLDLYGVHNCEGGKILRLVGLKLNAVSSNGKLAQYESNSLSDVAAIGRLAKSVGADRVEIVLGRAYDNGDTQPKSVLKKLADELEPKGWKRFDLAAGHPCVASPDGSLQFRVMVGPRFWGYLAKPRDESGEFDVMSMLTEVQERQAVEGRAIMNKSKMALVKSMEEAFRTHKDEFLADKRYAHYLVVVRGRPVPVATQKRVFWCEAMTGSWKLS